MGSPEREHRVEHFAQFVVAHHLHQGSPLAKAAVCTSIAAANARFKNVMCSCGSTATTPSTMLPRMASSRELSRFNLLTASCNRSAATSDSDRAFSRK